jgi:uncharacterized membrane protein YagU involved in acid resistance
MNKLLAGTLAGFAATAPMTVAMMLIYRRLHPFEIQALPQEEITAELERRTGVKAHLTRPEHEVVTWISHFGFGAGAGALYAPLAGMMKAHPVLKGAGYGLLVWAASYLGWLPAAGILHQTKEQPPRPNLMMIFAHLVWGVTLGMLTEKLGDT